jgi:thiamine pyrophosphate-dependent acetolactate synthase large subunit-like protein
MTRMTGGEAVVQSLLSHGLDPLFAVAELATAVQHGINLVTIVFNNEQYGNVQQMQRDLYGGRVIASDLRNPDFERLVSAFGAHFIGPRPRPNWHRRWSRHSARACRR